MPTAATARLKSPLGRKTCKCGRARGISRRSNSKTQFSVLGFRPEKPFTTETQRKQKKKQDRPEILFVPVGLRGGKVSPYFDSGLDSGAASSRLRILRSSMK